MGAIDSEGLNRRNFMKRSAAVVAGAALAGGSVASAQQTPDDGLDYRNYRPERMQYRKLGKTNFMCSRLVFGCGAALNGGKAVPLLERAFEAGVNHFDVGSNSYYKQAENHLAPFMKAHRDEIWVTSKAPVRASRAPEPGEPLDVEKAKDAASQWTSLLDASLKDLDTDHIDAYYIMMVDIPQLVASEEMHNAFFKAKEAGKVSHFGISSHRNAHECLDAAIDSGCYSLAMIAINPAGWYDLMSMGKKESPQDLKGLRPVLDRAREAGIGLVGMKAARHLSSARPGQKGPENVFNSFYGKKLMQASLTPFQRAYAYVLENGLDVVNADMQNYKHLEENFIAARDSNVYFA